ncbi:CLUMA_CG008697, isoform A [Clunio marinus]|uniref:CLUMA_CG008697, isoform A n=1 Tax=Clunio marinus TaxID=568069 RepID=A0A1J1I8D2_9DIPT|nr:CLUMA_CG008697, isoform A [Clunio marinus]
MNYVDITLMMNHEKTLEVICSLCPFIYCYRYFMGVLALIQIVYSTVEIYRIFRSSRDTDDVTLLNIPCLNVPISNLSFNLVRHTWNVSQNFELLTQTLTSESADELINFSVMSLAILIFSLIFYVMKFQNFSKEQRIVFLIMNIGTILNLMFLICFLFENCKNS